MPHTTRSVRVGTASHKSRPAAGDGGAANCTPAQLVSTPPAVQVPTSQNRVGPGLQADRAHHLCGRALPTPRRRCSRCCPGTRRGLPSCCTGAYRCAAWQGWLSSSGAAGEVLPVGQGGEGRSPRGTRWCCTLLLLLLLLLLLPLWWQRLRAARGHGGRPLCCPASARACGGACACAGLGLNAGIAARRVQAAAHGRGPHPAQRGVQQALQGLQGRHREGQQRVVLRRRAGPGEGSDAQ